MVKGKSKLCTTPLNGVTVENIGGIPFYDRYVEFEHLQHKYVSDRRYFDAFAEPLFNKTNGVVDWYVPSQLSGGIKLIDLKGTSDYDNYSRLKDTYVQYFKHLMLNMPEHDRQYFECMIKYANAEIGEHTTFCVDGKIVFGTWGMQLLNAKDISTVIRTDIDDRRVYSITYEMQGRGKFIGANGSIKRKYGHVLQGMNDIPSVVPEEGYEFTSWKPDAPHNKVVESDMVFTAVCSPLPQEDPVILPETPVSPEVIPESDVPTFSNVCFNPGTRGKLKGNGIVQAQNGIPLSPVLIPNVKPKRGYEFTEWDKDIDAPIDGDTTFHAQYKEVGRNGGGGLFGGFDFGSGRGFFGRGCLNWLIGILGGLLLLLLLSLLLRLCSPGIETTTTSPVVGEIEEVETYQIPEPVVEGELETTTTTTTTNTEVDYEAIKALIKEYQERIDKLVKMLPENE